MKNSIQTDQLSKSDDLDRERLAVEISDNIIHHIQSSSESLVIGIHGPWGSGKSNLLYFIKKHIGEHALYKKTQEALVSAELNISQAPIHTMRT